MKKKLGLKVMVLLILSLFSEFAFAALAPEYRNIRDLEVMVNFIKDHKRVISTLKSIDFENFVVYYGYDCKAEFGREIIKRPPGWVGPAPYLELKSSSCYLDD